MKNDRISNQQDFEEYLYTKKGIPRSKHIMKVENLEMEALSFIHFDLLNLNFYNCEFKNCQFDDFTFGGIAFSNCIFINCTFQHMTFMDCSMSQCILENPFSNTLLFGMTSFEETVFNNIEFQFTTFSDCRFSKVLFDSGQFYTGKFEPGDFNYIFKNEISFKRLNLSEVVFLDLDLENTTFNECVIDVDFIRCGLTVECIKQSTSNKLCGIDFKTLLKSENLPGGILKSIFGINITNIKDIVLKSTSIAKFYSVFISYSFKDGEIAKELKGLLIGEGIEVFLWENDAPGGEKLKKIMSDNIRTFDRFLFIASQNSLRSEACHFEISEARNKYYNSWASLFVPIHIDNYLFTLTKNDIPTKFASPYWENIKELKEFHSLDFCFAKKGEIIKSSPQYDRLLNTLKLS